MTRDEFMKHAAEEIDEALRRQKNRMMNLVEQAWAEGKRNAETEQVTEIVRGAVAEIQKQLQPVQPVVVPVPQPVAPFGEPITTPTWPISPIITCDARTGDVPEAHFDGGKTNDANNN